MGKGCRDESFQIALKQALFWRAGGAGTGVLQDLPWSKVTWLTDKLWCIMVGHGICLWSECLEKGWCFLFHKNCFHVVNQALTCGNGLLGPLSYCNMGPEVVPGARWDVQTFRSSHTVHSLSTDINILLITWWSKYKLPHDKAQMLFCAAFWSLIWRFKCEDAEYFSFLKKWPKTVPEACANQQ